MCPTKDLCDFCLRHRCCQANVSRRTISPVLRPQLVINYTPKLDLRIACVHVQGYGAVVLPEYRFEVDCRLRHATGSFTYSVSDLCFDLQSFSRFSKELQGMQQGFRQEAALKSVGEMMILHLEGNSRALQARLNVRESIGARLASLSAVFDVDYDLFVNKLHSEVKRFLEELRQIEPSPPEATSR